MQHNPKRQFWIILIIVFLGFLGISMPYLIFPALFLNPVYSILPSDWNESSHALLLGITLAAYPLGQFIGSPILGSLSDDYGRKRLLCGSLVLAGLSNFLTGLALDWQQLALVIVSRFTAGLMEGNIAIARAMASDIKTISKHETFGKINAASSIAFLIGPLVGGLLADNVFSEGVTISTPFYIISFLFFGLSALSAISLPDSTALSRNQVRSVWIRLNLIKRLSVLFQNKQLRFPMLISTFFTLAVDIFYQFGPVYLTAKWTIGPVQLIAYNTVLCLTLAIGNGWLAAFTSKRFTSYWVIISMGGFALFLFTMVFTNTSPLMLVLFGLSGLAIGLVVTLLTVRISDSVSDSIQGEVMGVQISLRVLGEAIICLIGGVLLILSPKLILVLAALISAGTLLFYYRYDQQL